MIKKAEHWPAKQKARVLQSVEEVIRLRKEPFVKSVTVVMTNQNAGYGLPEAMDREMTFIANRLRDYADFTVRTLRYVSKKMLCGFGLFLKRFNAPTSFHLRTA